MEYSGPLNYPRENGSPVSQVPIQSEGPTPFFPSMCVTTHWDPTAIIRRTLPTDYVAQALDPRPWAKICLTYTTTGEDLPPAPVAPGTVLPMGGEFYPISRYMAAIDKESELRRLDRPLGTCEGDQYFPNERGDMFNSRALVPKIRNVDPSKIEEIAFPKVLMSSGPYDCRYDADTVNIGLSQRMFNNATKQDRYKLRGQV